MIRYIKGNLFDSKAEAIVNTVNTVGVMGKGIALQFRKLFLSNYKRYLEECKSGNIKIGELLVTVDQNTLTGQKIIINFPTKKHWKNPSKYEYIEKGVIRLVEIIKEKKIKSIAIPPLGAGNGGLKWYKVRDILEAALINIEGCEIEIYEPNYQVEERLKKERVKLTPARSLLLYILYDLVKNGEIVSEFASEKICYFLQRFGAQKYFKLEYNAHFYGPYSGKVRHLLYYLNGSYILGFGDKNKKPFESLSLIMKGEEDVNDYLNKNPELKMIGENTKKFLSGFYSSFGLELLSTVDFILSSDSTNHPKSIIKEIESWSNRKKSLFTNNEKFIQISMNRINSTSFSGSVP